MKKNLTVMLCIWVTCCMLCISYYMDFFLQYDKARNLIQELRSMSGMAEMYPGVATSSASSLRASELNGERVSATGHLLDWSEAVGGQGHVYVHAPYLDRRREKHVIRMVALIVPKETDYIECTYWTILKNTATVRADITEIVDRPNLYRTVYIMCPVNLTNSEDKIERVTVSARRGQSNDYTASRPVDHLDTRKKLGELNVCIKVMHSEYNNVALVTEFIEMYKLLGADYFLFYNKSIGPDVETLLQYYINQGFVEAIPWNPPGIVDKDLHTSGVYASLNDCGLRSIGHFPLTAMVDLDEFFVPRMEEHKTLLDLVHHLGDYDSYEFRNVFFYLHWEDDRTLYKLYNLDNAKGSLPLMTQVKTRRCTQYFDRYLRSKYIMRADRVVEAGNHFTRDFVDRKTSKGAIDVGVDIAFSHHYRECSKSMMAKINDGCLTKNSSVDVTAHRFMRPLVSAVTSVCRTVFPGSPACPAASPKKP